ncbi:MAG: ATP-binding cassette domain-containing protein, partial [Ectothiorhodospiraceae bacterium]|nr:ATP-binding cassette domain-containing protein [Ectothiorhodospiraceae bacterium]
GKSTLLKLVAGEIKADSGEIARQQGLRVAMLEQAVPEGMQGSVFDVVAEGLGEAGALVRRYHQLVHAMADGADTMAELERCQHQLEAVNGWELPQRVEAVLSRLGLDGELPAASLSGGLRRRVLLGRALVGEPDLLLLDEPTNHLDIESITWLEDFLLGFNGALLFITHDRAFLRRLATRIIELDRGRLSDWPGDYDAYLERKQALLDAEEKQNALFDKRLAEEEVWIRRGIEARRTRNEGRVRALLKMREEFAARRNVQGSARIRIQEAARSGKLVVEAEDVSFAWNGNTIIRGFSTLIQRGDRVGLIGPNGSGKTTLLRLLLGQIEPTSGTIRLGTNLEIAYFDQYRAALEEEKSVQDNVAEGRDRITINGENRHVLGWLQDFLFTPARARQPVKALSGGERNRLLLARLFAKPSNLLVLDEPTNDLDADTLDLLEERLADYGGTVLLVSHDRAFLDNVVTSTIVFEGDGMVNEYVGGYSDWLRQRPAAAPTVKAEPTPQPKTPPPAPTAKPKKLSYKDARELEALPARIEAMEAERDALTASLSSPEIYQQGNDAVAAAQTKLEELERTLGVAYARWEALEALRSG